MKKKELEVIIDGLTCTLDAVVDEYVATKIQMRVAQSAQEHAKFKITDLESALMERCRILYKERKKLDAMRWKYLELLEELSKWMAQSDDLQEANGKLEATVYALECSNQTLAWQAVRDELSMQDVRQRSIDSNQVLQIKLRDTNQREQSLKQDVHNKDVALDEAWRLQDKYRYIGWLKYSITFIVGGLLAYMAATTWV